MLQIRDVIYRIEGRLILEGARASVPAGHKVGLVGRNGAGKTTLLRLLHGEMLPDEGEISAPRNARIAMVAQEAPGGPERLIDVVLAADTERAALLTEAEHARDPHRIAEIQLRLADIDAHSAPARASAILSGLGFDETAQRRPCSTFSGGWRMRVALAATLFAAPDILLLDEPTNYLDLEGSLWLESFLAAYRYTVIIVSHDRDLLNRAVRHILHLERGRLTLYAGGYDAFEATRREQQRLQLKLRKKQDDERRHIETFVERFRYKATKARQAQSRLKALARMQPIVAEVEGRLPPFRFPAPGRPLGNPLMRLEGVAAGYEADRPVLRDLDLRIDSDDRIALLGANGNGKSTLAKLLAGTLAPLSGTRHCSKKLVVGYFAQHQLDALDPAGSPFDHIAALMSGATEAQKRARLGALGFGVEKADTISAKLSGGEKARLLLALATFHGPHLLILDEPTNHLDVDAREALGRALADYSGTVILISHDRHLIEASADRLWLVADGTVRPWEGDLDGYSAECLSARGRMAERSGMRRGNGRDGRDGESGAPRGKAKARRKAARRRAELAPLRHAVKRFEREIAHLGEAIAALDGRLGDTALYDRDPEEATRLARQRASLVHNRHIAEEAWLAASEAYEAEAGEVEEEKPSI